MKKDTNIFTKDMNPIKKFFFNRRMKKWVKEYFYPKEIIKEDPCPFCGTQQPCPEDGCWKYKSYRKYKGE
jgi:hypothetical protein